MPKSDESGPEDSREECNSEILHRVPKPAARRWRRLGSSGRRLQPTRYAVSSLPQEKRARGTAQRVSEGPGTPAPTPCQTLEFLLQLGLEMFTRITWLAGLLVLKIAHAAPSPPDVALLEPPILEGIRVEGVRPEAAEEISNMVSVEVEEPLDAAEVWGARRELLGSGRFDAVELRLVRGQGPGRAILVISVKERGPVAASADVGGFATGVLTLGLAYRAPGGVVPSAQVFFGEEVPGFALGLDAVDVLNSGLNLALRAYRRGREGLFPSVISAPVGTDFASEVAETGVSFSRRGVSLELIRGLRGLTGTALSVGYRIERLEGDNLNASFALGGRQQLVSAASLGLVHDTLDSDAFPGKGRRAWLRLVLSDESIGSDYDYLRSTLQAEGWLRAQSDLAFRFAVRGGMVTGSAPFSEHFFAEDFVRGYASYSAAAGLGADGGVAGSLELGWDARPSHGLRKLRLGAFGDFGVLLRNAPVLGWRRGGVWSLGVSVAASTSFGLLRLTVPLIVGDNPLPPFETLPLPRRGDP